MASQAAFADGTDGFRTSDGVWLAVTDSGARDAAVTVLFAHGWTLDSRSWDDLTALLVAGAGVPVRAIAVDCRGHGRSGPAGKGGATLARYADDLAELIDRRIPTGRVVLVGHSMGGMAMMALAERHEDLVRRRVAGAAFLATAAGRLDKAVAKVPGLLSVLLPLVGLGFRVYRVLPAALRRRAIAWLLFGREPRALDVARTVDEMQRADPRSMHRFGRDIMAHDRAHHLSRYESAATLVAAGSQDKLCPPTHARKIASRLPSSTLLVYPGAGHQLPYECAVDLAPHLIDLAERAASFDVDSARGTGAAAPIADESA
ncbi:alpha/beta fold hydrolase [Rhodococcus daqingensis]|uniref:Alpha/beta fold hydrolase n=1 Tax=Rhodococcus daqingensis TaxID=2479363 RepID=A0ABW2S080_9NOCA